MRKIVATLVILFGLFTSILSQTVDSIKVEQVGELIKIQYKIFNSSPSQIFRITVFCSINGGLQSVIKSLSGDFGDNVIGGRSDYIVLWDVLKDVDEVKSVDFSVRAELLKDNSLSETNSEKDLSERKVYLYFVGGGPGPKFGGKIGYIGSWGLTAMFLAGKTDALSNLFYNNEKTVISIGLDLTKRIVNSQKFNMHLLAGLNFANLPVTGDINDPVVSIDDRVGYEGGLIFSIKRFTTSVTFNYFTPHKGGTDLVDDSKFVYIGLGYRF